MTAMCQGSQKENGIGDELQRTVYVGNVDPSCTAEMVLSFFGKVGFIDILI